MQNLRDGDVHQVFEMGYKPESLSLKSESHTFTRWTYIYALQEEEEDQGIYLLVESGGSLPKRFS